LDEKKEYDAMENEMNRKTMWKYVHGKKMWKKIPLSCVPFGKVKWKTTGLRPYNDDVWHVYDDSINDNGWYA
jgi:hypothetical protein